MTSHRTASRPEVKEKVKRPSLYNVILLNDDFTPMDFVVHILQKFFNKSASEAFEIMLNVHHSGSAVAGSYTFELAETKSLMVNEYAKQNNYPLKSTIKREC